MDGNCFAGRLRELREAACLTQAQLAERLNTTVRNISRLETGAQEATWPTVVKLCTAFGVSCEEFLKPAAPAAPKPRGRPPKAKPADAADKPTPKKPRREKGE